MTLGYLWVLLLYFAGFFSHCLYNRVLMKHWSTSQLQKLLWFSCHTENEDAGCRLEVSPLGYIIMHAACHWLFYII